MDKIAGIPQQERNELFQETAAGMGIPEAIVEKDFWVCWILPCKHLMFLRRSR